MRKKAILCLTAALLLTACASDKTAGQNSSADAVEAIAPEVSESVADTPSTAEEPSSDSKESEISDSSSLPEESNSSESAPMSKEERKKLKKQITLDYADTAEVYSRIKLSDLITTNAELKEPDTLLDTSELGQCEQTVEVLFKGESFSMKLKYNVVDTTSPVCLNPGEGSVIATGSEFDLNSLVGFADNCDRHPSLSYTGYVDTSVAGVYPITAIVRDSSGNYTSWEMDITVSDMGASQPPSYAGEPTYFSDFMQQYAGNGRHFGIDVSTWQGNVDYKAVKNAGCEFVIIRMGYSSDGYIHPDDQYEANIRNARAAGLKVGVYFYSQDSREDIARGVARWIAQTVGDIRLDFPVAFDWEDFYHFQNYGMSIHDLNEVFEAFADELDKSGFDTMLYGSKNFLEKFWTNRGGHPVWVANYTDSDNYEGDHMIWQRCGSGIIDGIDGAVDLNILYD